MNRASALSITAILALASGVSIAAQQPRIDPSGYSAMVWRNVGPFRGGRIAAVSGAIGQPGVFYVGLPAGGVWKTTSAGETWYPVFDSVKTVSSIGVLRFGRSWLLPVYSSFSR